MVNIEQFRTSPLNGESFGAVSNVLIKETPYIQMWDLRVDPASATFKKVESIIGFSLPLTVGASNSLSQVTALTLGPDWWLLVGADETLMNQIQTQTTSEFISLVNVSAQRTCIEITGPQAKEVLQHSWEQDLDEVSFPDNACSQGLMARCPVIINKKAKSHYLIYVRSSFADHLFRFLIDAATEYVK